MVARGGKRRALSRVIDGEWWPIRARLAPTVTPNEAGGARRDGGREEGGWGGEVTVGGEDRQQ